MKKAFTLVEVLVVLAVVGVLIGLLAVGGRQVLENQKDVRIRQELSLLLAAAESGTHAGTSDFTPEGLLRDGFLAVPLVPPVAGYTYRVDESAGVLRVTLEKGGKVYAHGTFYAEQTKGGHPR